MLSIYFRLQICCVSFPQRDQLFAHLMDHRQQPRYDCCICRLCFQDLLELEDHYVGNPDFCGKFYDKEGKGISRNTLYRMKNKEYHY